MWFLLYKKWVNIFLNRMNHLVEIFNVKVNLSNYATKTDIKSISHTDTSSFALKWNLASLKTEVDKLDIDKSKSLSNLSNLKSKVDIDKLAPAPVDLSKPSNLVKNDVVKKTEYNCKIKNIEDKIIPDSTNLATKINEVKTEIPSISNNFCIDCCLK